MCGRWALGDPMELPPAILSIGGRYGYDDDGDTANTQILYVDQKPAPILFEVRGLPKKGLNWKNGMPNYRGVTIGNVIEYEGGSLLGGHGASCKIVDKDGKLVKEFKGGQNHNPQLLRRLPEVENRIHFTMLRMVTIQLRLRTYRGTCVISGEGTSARAN